MPLADVDIEWIVHEVVRRLRDLDAGASNNTSTPDAHALKINDTVITLATLEDRINGVRCLVVSRRAVVTPAVVDELKDRKIELVRCGRMGGASANGSSNPPTPGPLVVVMEQSIDISSVARLLPRVRVVQEPSPVNAALLETVKRHVAQDNYAVLLTSAPAAAVVSVNREPAIRAALGFNFPAVRQAVDEAGANVLAIDPNGKSTTQIAGLINEFLKRT